MAQCKYCHKTGLHWKSIHSKWILHEDAKVNAKDQRVQEHYCKWKHIKHLEPGDRPFNQQRHNMGEW